MSARMSPAGSWSVYWCTPFQARMRRGNSASLSSTRSLTTPWMSACGRSGSFTSGPRGMGPQYFSTISLAERGRRLRAGDDLEVVGAVDAGGAVGLVAAARAHRLEQLERRLDVLGGREEEQVLEQVRKAAPPRHLVGGADVVPDVDGHLGQAVVLAEDHRQAVGELVLLELDLGIAGARGRSRQRENDEESFHGARSIAPASGWQGANCCTGDRPSPRCPPRRECRRARPRFAARSRPATGRGRGNGPAPTGPAGGAACAGCGCRGARGPRRPRRGWGS